MPEKMSKAALAAHVGEAHGRVRNITPIQERLRWSMAELEAAHAWLRTKGMCGSADEAVGQ